LKKAKGYLHWAKLNPISLIIYNVKEKKMNLAQIMVSGNIGQPPVIKTVGDTKVANFSIAVNENWTDKSGGKQEKTHWYNCEAWDGKNGKGLVTNVIEPYAKQGTTVFVQGMPINESYEKDGEKKTAFKIKLAGMSSTFRLINTKSLSDTGVKASPKVDSDTDDEIPF